VDRTPLGTPTWALGLSIPVVSLGLLALCYYAGGSRLSIDYYLERRITWWWRVAEMPSQIQLEPLLRWTSMHPSDSKDRSTSEIRLATAPRMHRMIPWHHRPNPLAGVASDRQHLRRWRATSDSPREGEYGGGERAQVIRPSRRAAKERVEECPHAGNPLRPGRC
jgi:hypothetical protein